MKHLKEKISEYLTNKAVHILARRARYLAPKCVSDGFDRNYIDNYIAMNKMFLTGDILEFNGDVLYSQIYADKTSKIYTASSLEDKDKCNSDFYFDLNQETTLPDKKFDCIIATQVICYMLDGKGVLNNLKKMLKPNGVLVLTNSGPIYQDNQGYGYLCFYTTDGLRELCKNVFGNQNVFNVKNYGNLRTAIQSLLGTKRDTKYKDDNQSNLSVIIGICCKNAQITKE